MSESPHTNPTTDEERNRYDDALTAEEEAVFERLAERFADDEIGRICETVLQSSANEEANS